MLERSLQMYLYKIDEEVSENALYGTSLQSFLHAMNFILHSFIMITLVFTKKCEPFKLIGEAK